MTQTNPEQWAVELWRDANNEWFDARDAETGTAAAIAFIQAAFAEREEKAGFERRNIISHATMGNTTGEGMSVNDICVEISRQRNKLYQAGKDASAEREARLVGALRNLENANDRACGARPQKVYDAMIAAGMTDALIELDDARREARATLAALKDRTHG